MKNLIPALEMPAIYSFDFLYLVTLKDAKGFGRQHDPSKWGWHKASELFEAINNTLTRNGMAEMTAEEIEKRFFHIGGRRNTLVVHGDGSSWIFSGSQWLRSCLEKDSFLPAKIGISILNEIKHPKFSAVKKALVNFCSVA